MDFQAYIASDEEDSEDDEEARERYKKLLLGNSDDEEENEDNNQEMEITFAPGLSQAAQDILDKKKEKEVSLSKNFNKNKCLIGNLYILL